MENLVINADSLTAFPEGLIQGPDGTQDFGFSSGTLDDSAARGFRPYLEKVLSWVHSLLLQ